MEKTRHEQILEDSHELHRFGYAQQLFRDMGGFSNFALSFSIISILTGALTAFGQGLYFGGPAINGLGWPLVTFFSLAVAASMAEIASAIPTAGAMYHWSALLGGPGWGWFTAWFNFIGQVAITAGIDYGAAAILVPLLGLEPTQTNLLTACALLLLSHGLFNHFGIRVVSWLNNFSAVYHVVGTLALIAVLAYFAPLRPLSFAFTPGYTASEFPYRWAFLVGLLQAQWTLTGYDASAHITEETMDPRRNAPWGMFLSVLVSGVFGFALMVMVTLSIQNLDAAARDVNPFIYILTQALGESGGRAVIWAILLAAWFCGLSAVTSNARMVFAFARDKGFPYSEQLASISPRYRTPAVATWVTLALAFILTLYSKVFTIIVATSIVGLYISYILPVILWSWKRLRGQPYPLGPWNMGRLGPWVNALAIAWVAFISVIFISPPNQLAGTTFAGLLLFLLLYYFANARRAFKGPRKLGTEEELMRLETKIERETLYHEP